MITKNYNSTMPLSYIASKKSTRYVSINYPDNKIPEYCFGNADGGFMKISKKIFEKFVREFGYKKIKKVKHNVAFFK